MIAGAVLAAAPLRLSRPPTPPGLLHPPSVWIYNVVIPIVGSLIIVALAVDSIRKRRLTWASVFIVCSALTWWMETMGDWGQELIYSPRLAYYHISWLPVSTPIRSLLHALRLLRVLDGARMGGAGPGQQIGRSAQDEPAQGGDHPVRARWV